jgi:O-acetyl-ADP-ribose deacetylase (regulator of RNase III)
MMILELIKGDITTITADAIVNAANTSLLGGGGVDGAIHRKGGKAILDDCIAIRNRQGGCAAGQAVITTAGNLPAKYVIHTVGPVWQGGHKNETGLLRDCYQNSLILASEYGLRSIAFPSISTGIYHFPKELACTIALKTIKDFNTPESFDRILLVCFDEDNYGYYKKHLDHE